MNEQLLKTLNWTPEQALGKKIKINEGEATIVGIVSDFHNNSLQYDITPCVFTNWKYFHDHAFIKIGKGHMPPLSFIENQWKNNYPESVYTYHFLDESIEKEYLVERLIQAGFTIFSILVIIIGCLGIFGLMSFITIQKRKEVGIRKVLGASVFQIVNYFSKEFIFLILISFLISAPVCYYLLERWLVNFSYRIELTVDMFLLGGIITLLIALISSAFQTVGAALVNPVHSLRSE